MKLNSRAGLTSLFALVSLTALPCCIAYRDRPVRLAKETAILVWDEENKIEHFMRRAEFSGAGGDFGFIFPSPTEPLRIEVANSGAFGLLESLHRMRKAMGSKASGGGFGGGRAGGVEVLQQKEVGDYEVAVLRANNGNALGDWLKKYGFGMRPSIKLWLDHYAKQGWILSAFKYKGQKGAVPTSAVCISFRAKQPHYPYKMPFDTWPTGHFRPLDLFVVSQRALVGQNLRGSVWPANTSWVEPMEPHEIKRLGELMGGETGLVTLPKQLVVTRFSNTKNATDYDSDLTFKPPAR